MKEMLLEPLKMYRISVSKVKKEKKVEGIVQLEGTVNLLDRYLLETYYVLDTG